MGKIRHEEGGRKAAAALMDAEKAAEKVETEKEAERVDPCRQSETYEDLSEDV